VHWFLFHDIAVMYGWLYAQGIWRSVLGVLVAAVLAWVLRIGKRLKRIESHLDTSTPGGLTSVVNAINNANAPDNTGG
jgi:hypothetical protein